MFDHFLTYSPLSSKLSQPEIKENTNSSQHPQRDYFAAAKCLLGPAECLESTLHAVSQWNPARIYAMIVKSNTAEKWEIEQQRQSSRDVHNVSFAKLI